MKVLDAAMMNGQKIELIDKEPGLFVKIGSTVIGSLCRDSTGHLVQYDMYDEDRVDLMTGRAWRRTMEEDKPKLLKFFKRP